ncbi:hypothetical protein NDU88_002333 [Pleurodeles waltl]|uniref:Uncharacterized protein n=1 Tax=Pleurodeles waltl TaxID=8319 RepID=A0AAV7TMA4_PLEWA|nr:hypothetical protein NDU88_002333 [Pleurodeles waltl]
MDFRPGGKCTDVSIWWLYPAVLADALYRDSLREAIAEYFKVDQDMVTDCMIKWEAFKMVIRERCLSRSMGVQRCLSGSVHRYETYANDYSVSACMGEGEERGMVYVPDFWIC